MLRGEKIPTVPPEFRFKICSFFSFFRKGNAAISCGTKKDGIEKDRTAVSSYPASLENDFLFPRVPFFIIDTFSPLVNALFLYKKKNQW